VNARRTVFVYLLIAAGVSATVYWWGHDAREGARDAERDIAKGELRMKCYGLPARWSQQYHALMRERYGIEMETVGGCVVTENVASYTRAYNEVMEREIERRFGRHVFDDVAEDARELFEKDIVKPNPAVDPPLKDQ
jgi:hypothetical protein